MIILYEYGFGKAGMSHRRMQAFPTLLFVFCMVGVSLSFNLNAPPFTKGRTLKKDFSYE